MATSKDPQDTYQLVLVGSGKQITRIRAPGGLADAQSYAQARATADGVSLLLIAVHNSEDPTQYNSVGTPAITLDI